MKNKTNLTTFLATCVGALVGLLPSAQAAAPQGYAKVWEDTFDGPSLNAGNWTIGLWGDRSNDKVPGTHGQCLLNGATVTGTFRDSFKESRSAITDANGVAVLTTGGKAKKPVFTFAVTGVARSSDDYDPTANVQTSATCPNLARQR